MAKSTSNDTHTHGLGGIMEVSVKLPRVQVSDELMNLARYSVK